MNALDFDHQILVFAMIDGNKKIGLFYTNDSLSNWRVLSILLGIFFGIDNSVGIWRDLILIDMKIGKLPKYNKTSCVMKSYISYK